MNENNQNNPYETQNVQPENQQVECQQVENQQPVYNQADYAVSEVVEEEKPSKVFGIISMICGIVALLLSCCCGILVTGPFSIASIILAFVEKSKTGKLSGMAIAGLITSIIAILMGIISFIYMIASGASTEIVNSILG